MSAVLARLGWRRLLGQAAGLGLFVLFLGYFSNRPEYRHLDPGLATVKLSLRHAGQILGECHERTAEELANLPANMRVSLVCPRERSPLLVELVLNGELMLSDTLPARGVHSDGRASMYRRLSVPAGELTVLVRLKDHIGVEDFQYESSRSVSLAPGDNLVIDFDEDLGAFRFNNGEQSAAAGSDDGPALENALDHLEADHGEHEDDHEVDETAIGQRLAASLLDEANDPVRQKVQAHGHDGE